MAGVSSLPEDISITAARKKFATPPVKIACLACRASRTRCNGENPCASCTSRDRTCIYKPSRRGGPRTRKKPRPTPLEDDHELPSPYSEPVAAVPSNLSVENYINPGAGLKNLTEVLNDSDLLFDSLFMSVNPGNMVTDVLQAADEAGPIVRIYRSDAAALNAYYIWIHPYFPILPPPDGPLVPDEAVPLFQNRPSEVDESQSPVALAISALLALIPHPDDANPLSDESIRFRRNYSQFLAQSAFERTEGESDKPSDVEPSMALDDSDDDDETRPQFHGGVPLALESVIALDLLSVYEYAQRGNLKRMRNRASSALVLAMNLSLHIHNDMEDGFAEARRRVWWMTYICICQSSIVSNTHPAFAVFASSFTAKIPTIHGDPEAWPLFIKSQQAILTATQFVIELNKAMSAQADMTPIYQRMIDLEMFLEPLVMESEAWVLNCPLTQLVDSHEAIVAHCLRCMAKFKLNSARIKIHRYCAFFDLPVFPRKNCDLKPMQEKEKDAQEIRNWPSCCGALLGDHAGGSQTQSHSGSSASPTQSMRSTPNSEGSVHFHVPPALVFPYSSHQSAKICLKSALNIAQAFASLAYPNPTMQAHDAPCYIGPTSTVLAPRTMPSFACCAMQCAYVLLMVHEKTQSMYPGWNGDAGAMANDLLGRLQQGLLSILATLENYGTAFEALGGMRDQIREKVYSSITFNDA